MEQAKPRMKDSAIAAGLRIVSAPEKLNEAEIALALRFVSGAPLLVCKRALHQNCNDFARAQAELATGIWKHELLPSGRFVG